MDAFVKSNRSLPALLFESSEIVDRESVFVGAIYRATSVKEVKAAVQHHKYVTHAAKKASHEMNAWRIMALKAGKDGLSGPDDFEISSGSDDDGEKYGSSKILKIMQKEGILDAVVIVSRWYGGILLGPARFTHIEACASEVCTKLKATEEVEDCISRLHDLDTELTQWRKTVSGKDSTIVKKANYNDLKQNLDVAKAKRLVAAREKAIASLKKVIHSKPEGAPASNLEVLSTENSTSS